MTSTVMGSQAGITVQAAGLHSLRVSGAPVALAAGQYVNVTVSAVDAYGNPVPGYTGTIQLTSSDPKAGLPGQLTFTGANAGVLKTFVQLETAGVQSITAIDSIDGLTATGSGITVQAASLRSFKVSGFPATDTAGARASFTVSAVDIYGNIISGYMGTVQFTSSDPQASLPAGYTFTAADAGTHTFSAIFKTPGTQWITATDTATPSITGSEVGIKVQA